MRVHYATSILSGDLLIVSFLLISRIVQSQLMAVPVAFSIVRDIFPAKKLAIAVGICGSTYSSGSIVGLLAAANVQLPFMIVFLVLTSATAFIISKVGSVKQTIVGTIIALIGTLSMLLFNSLSEIS